LGKRPASEIDVKRNEQRFGTVRKIAGSTGSRLSFELDKRTPRQIWFGGLIFALAALAGGAILLTGWLDFSDPDGIWAHGEASVRSGRFDLAQRAIERLSRRRAPTALDWLLRAQVATGLGDDDGALEALSHVEDHDAMAGQARLLAGRIERRHHRLRRAEASLRAALEREPGLIEAHKELVYIFGIGLRKRELDAEFKALSRLTPLTHHDLFTWGLTHFTDWDPGIATELEAALDIDPDDRHSRLALANLLFDQPDMEDRVLKILEPLPEGDPDAAALRVELNLVHGRIEAAIALLENAPHGHPRLARLRGRVALLRRDHAAAIRHFREALTGEPFDRVAMAELGKALVLAGDRPAAQEYQTRARRLDDVYSLINRVSRPDRENQPFDLARLGAACEAAGLREEEQGWYRLAIAREPLDAKAQQGLRRLRDENGSPATERGAARRGRSPAAQSSS
jgi:tetratricopeptide (TPR) repeat protein